VGFIRGLRGSSGGMVDEAGVMTGAGILMRGLLGGGMVEVEGILRGLWRIRGLEGGGGNVVEVGRA